MAPLSSLWSFAIGPSYASRPESGSSDLTAATPTTVCHSMEPEAVLGWGRSLFVELGHLLHGLDDVAAGVGKQHRSPLTRLGQPDGISPSRMAEMLGVDKVGPKVRC